MRISVIIPAHNARSTLGEAIESVRAQTLPAAEIVVVDDGSTDDTAAVAAGFQDVRLVRRPNGGPGAAYNSGIEVSQGDLVAFLDADDIMAPMALAEHVQNLTAHPAADASVGHVSEFVSHPLALAVLAVLLLIAIAGGMFVVPLYAFLTTKVDPGQAARTVAANNIVNSAAMVVGSLLAVSLSALGVPITEQLLLSAAMCIVSAWLALILYRAEKPEAAVA